MRPCLGASYPLEVTLAFPVRDRLVVGGRLGAVEMRIVLDDLGAECARGEIAGGKKLDGVAQAVGHPRQALRGVDVADEAFRRVDAVRDAVEPRGERRGEGEVRVAVGSGNAAFDAQARAV